MSVSNVASADFERALEASLMGAGLGSANRQNSLYLLNADLLSLNQPLMGFDMTVTANVRYALIERASNQTLAERLIVSPYTAKMSDAFVGVERLKLANEGAMRSNIQQVIDFLLQFRIAPKTVATP